MPPPKRQAGGGVFDPSEEEMGAQVCPKQNPLMAMWREHTDVLNMGRFLSLSLPSPALTPSMSQSAWALQTAPCHCQPQEEPGAGQEAELQSSLPSGHYRGRQESKGLVLPPRTLHPASPEMVQIPQ